jgi:hypothetical protein
MRAKGLYKGDDDINEEACVADESHELDDSSSGIGKTVGITIVIIVVIVIVGALIFKRYLKR